MEMANVNKVALFRHITEKMANTYENKNETYGNSFGIGIQKYGLISALTSMSDKFHRIEHLICGGENKVPDESLKDTLLDLACYSIMTLIEIDPKFD